MFVCLFACLCACLFYSFLCFGRWGRQVCVLVVSAEVCGAELCLVSRFVRGRVCSFVFLVCASFVVGASLAVWGFMCCGDMFCDAVTGFGVARFHLCSALFIVVGFGRSWRFWFVCVRAHLQAACCVVSLRAHTSSTSPSRGNKVDGSPRAASVTTLGQNDS